MKLAIFKNIEYDFTDIMSEQDVEIRGRHSPSEFVRTSEWAEVEFPKRDHEKIARESVAVLNKQIDQVNARAGDTITSIEGRIATLLALPEIK